MLNRSGYESNRNLDKPYRPMRVSQNKDGTVKNNDMDFMKLGVNGQRVNSTGCFGIKSTYGIGHISIINKKRT